MPFIPHTESDIAAMLASIGAADALRNTTAVAVNTARDRQMQELAQRLRARAMNRESIPNSRQA